MKTISPELKAHLAGEVLTICVCWKLVRKNGIIQGFTNNSVDIPYTDDFADTVNYEASTGFMPSNIKSTENLAVDNLDIIGLLDSSGINADDIAAGLYEDAKVYIFILNYEDLTMGDLKLSSGTLGDIVKHRSSFVAEFRSLSQKLQQKIGENYSTACRANLFDDRCKLIGYRDIWQPNTNYAVGDDLDATDRDGRYYVNKTAGVSGSIEPTWDTTIDNDTNGVATDIAIDGIFANACGVNWTCESPATITGGLAVFDGTQVAVTNIWQTTAAVLSRDYSVSFTISNYIAGNIRIVCGTTNGTLRSANGTHVETLQFAANGNFYLEADVDFDGDIDNVTIIEVVTTVWTCKDSWIKPGSVTTATNKENFTDSTKTEVDNYFNYGLVTWVDGNNIDLSMEVKIFASGTFQLVLPMPYDIQIDDKYTVYRGCPKTSDHCITIRNNKKNFRGEDLIPGTDELVKFGGQ